MLNAAGETITCLMVYDDIRGVWNRCRQEDLDKISAGGLRPEQIAGLPMNGEAEGMSRSLIQEARDVACSLLRGGLSWQEIAVLESQHPWLKNP